VLEVQLPENPTTGYRWAVAEYDARILHLEESALASGGGGIGGGGVRAFAFRALLGGETPLRLKHWREWQGESSVDDRFEVTVRVLE
jgi:inhibitor of cysteine peptidase